MPESSLGDRFLISLDIEQTMTLQNDQGIVFNYQDAQNYFLFSTCDVAGQVGAFRRVDGEWLTMHSCRTVDAIRDDGPNQLIVIGNNGYLQFFINEQFVSDLWDNTHSGGGVGIYIEMDADQTNTFTFDNLEVRAPDSGQ